MSGLILEKAGEGKVPLGERMEALGGLSEGSSLGDLVPSSLPILGISVQGGAGHSCSIQRVTCCMAFAESRRASALCVCVLEGGHQNSLNRKRQLEHWPHSGFCLGTS